MSLKVSSVISVVCTPNTHDPEQKREQHRGDGGPRPHADQNAETEQVAEKQHDDGNGKENPRLPGAAADADDQKAGGAEAGDLEGDEQKAAEIFRQEQPQAADRFGEIEVDSPGGDKIGEEAGGGNQRQDRGDRA